MNAGTLRDPHGAGRIARTGVAASSARQAVILLHGRGGAPEDMLGLAEHLALPDVEFSSHRWLTVVFFELWTIAFIKYRFMNSALGPAIAQVFNGGVLIFFVSVLVGGV